MSDTREASLTTMEAALLRSRGMSAPTVSLDRKSWTYTAVVIRPSGKPVSAIGPSAADATSKVLRLALS
jgi:hypothetical protein